MEFLLQLADPWAYFLIALLAAAEASAFVGLFIPGEAAMLLGGVLVFQGRASLGLMLLAACAGVVIGDSIGYEIGRHFGSRLRTGRLGRRIGEKRWDRAHEYVRRRGGRAVFSGRFVGVLRALVPAIAGSAGIPYGRFLVFNAAGGVIWATAFVLLGYAAGSSYQIAERWAGRATAVLAGLIILGLAISFAARWVRDHQEKLTNTQPGLDRHMIEELSTLRFVEEKANLLLVGRPGVGKTHIALGLGYRAVEARLSRLLHDRSRPRRALLTRRARRTVGDDDAVLQRPAATHCR